MRRTLKAVDAAAELSEFLTTRRANITPDQVGLPTYGTRRVKGLRREEVASLAGVSVEYYKRLERGNASGASDTVLDALANALQLDDAERAHLFDLARAANPGAPRRQRRSSTQRVRPSFCRSSLRSPPPRRSATAAATTSPPTRSAAPCTRPCSKAANNHANSARFTFLDPTSQEFFIDWDHAARDLVAHLRSEAGRNPYGRALSDLIGELSTRSDPFRKWWAAHDVRYHQTGTKRLRHPIVGELELNYEVMPIPGDGLRLAIFTAEVGSRSADGLQLLSSWSTTTQLDEATTDGVATTRDQDTS